MQKIRSKIHIKIELYCRTLRKNNICKFLGKYSSFVQMKVNRDQSLFTPLEQVSLSHSMFRLFYLKFSALNNQTRKNQAGYRLVF